MVTTRLAPLACDRLPRSSRVPAILRHRRRLQSPIHSQAQVQLLVQPVRPSARGNPPAPPVPPTRTIGLLSPATIIILHRLVMDLYSTPVAQPFHPNPLRLGASMALAGQLATLSPKRQAKLSCVRGTCCAPSPSFKQPKGYYFVATRHTRKRGSPSLTLTPPRRKRTLSLATLSPRSEEPPTPKSPHTSWSQRALMKATPHPHSLQTISHRWGAHW